MTDDPQGAGDWNADVQEAMERAQELDALQHPVPKHRSKAGLLGILFIPLVVVLAWNVWLVTRAPAPMETNLQEANLAGMVYVLSQQLQTYYTEHGSYPDSLGAVAPALSGVSYRLERGGYVLEAMANDAQIVFGSWEDPNLLLAQAANAGGQGGGS